MQEGVFSGPLSKASWRKESIPKLDTGTIESFVSHLNHESVAFSGPTSNRASCSIKQINLIETTGPNEHAHQNKRFVQDVLQNSRVKASSVS